MIFCSFYGRKKKQITKKEKTHFIIVNPGDKQPRNTFKRIW